MMQQLNVSGRVIALWPWTYQYRCNKPLSMQQADVVQTQPDGEESRFRMRGLAGYAVHYCQAYSVMRSQYICEARRGL